VWAPAPKLSARQNGSRGLSEGDWKRHSACFDKLLATELVALERQSCSSLSAPRPARRGMNEGGKRELLSVVARQCEGAR
jgi:hypothetical protein